MSTGAATNSGAATGGEAEAARALREVWDAFTADPAVGVCVIDETGKILYANGQIARMFLQTAAKNVVGRSLHELYPKAWADERIGVLRRVAETGRPVVLRHIRRGKQLQSTITLMRTPPGRYQRFLTVSHEGEHAVLDEDRFEVIESGLADLGPLDVLTARELEVLALLKQGMSLSGIARLLHRSAKTIEKHRDAIGRKLGVSGRVELARMAAAAGLEVSDAGLKRTHES